MDQLSLFDPLQDFQERLPNTPYCSNTKRLKYILPKEEAIGFPYIQVNYPYIDYICYDVDYPDAAIRAEEVDLPGATLTVMTPDSRHAHLLYALADPLPRLRKHQSKKTKELLKDVIFAYKEMLCADKCITTQKQLVKNALSPKWDVWQGYKPFGLSELAESIPEDLNQKRQFQPIPKQMLSAKPFKETLQEHSRNCSLFENARFYAYSIVKDHASYESLYNRVLAYLQHLNEVEIPKSFPKKVMTSELRSIAKSISRWTYDRRHQFKQVNRGAMGFASMTYWDPKKKPKETTRRQKLSAHRTHKIQKEVTRQKIQTGIELCLKHGFKPTPKNISTLAGVCRQTLYNHDYKEIIKSVHYGVSGYIEEKPGSLL